MSFVNYIDLGSKVSFIRNKYGFASMVAIENMKNSVWIVTNLNALPPPDVALLVEYERDTHIRQKLFVRLEEIISSESSYKRRDVKIENHRLQEF